MIESGDPMALNNKSKKKETHNKDDANDKPKKRGPENKNKANGRQTNGDKAIKDYGDLLYKNMPEDKKRYLTSKSGTLHFLRIIGLDSRHGSNTEPGVLGYDHETGKPNREGTTNAMLSIGVELVSDEDIVVPRIRMDITKRLSFR